MNIKNTGNGVLGGMFGKASTATAPKRENLSGKVDGTTIEEIVTSPNFTLVEGLLTGSILVTPELAAYFLTINKNIRPLNEAIYLPYKESMDKGQWDFNGETLKFDEKGKMVDGQNRCTACVLSGKPFMTSIIYGIKSALNVDRGGIRKVDQIIAAEGFAANPKTMSAMINYLHAYADAGSKGFITVGHGRHPLTMEDRMKFAKSNAKALNHSINVTEKARKQFNNPSLHAALHFVFAQEAGVEAADDFYTKLILGNGLSLDDPIYHLRERLHRVKREGNKEKGINQNAGLIIKGWNYYISGKRVTRFQYNFATDGVAKIKGS